MVHDINHRGMCVCKRTLTWGIVQIKMTEPGRLGFVDLTGINN